MISSVIKNPTFQFTRHALSCNNINNFINKAFEPSISFSGIVDTIMFSKENKGAFTNDKVCVSNLLRTWITAVLLYGNNTGINETTKKRNPLSLYICPHLKEYTKIIKYLGIEIKRGNWPERFNSTLNNFLKFLNNGPQYNSTWYSNLPEKIIFFLPDKNNQWQSVELQKIQGKYVKNENKKSMNGVFYNSVGPRTIMRGYLENGNLQEFMRWYISKFGLNISDKSNKVHIITHSNVMKEYMRRFYNNNIIYYNKIRQTIKENNVCRFNTTINQPLNDPPKIIGGIIMDIKKAIRLEKKAKNLNIALCSKLFERRLQNITRKLKPTRFRESNKMTRRFGGKKKKHNNKRKTNKNYSRMRKNYTKKNYKKL